MDKKYRERVLKVLIEMDGKPIGKKGSKHFEPHEDVEEASCCSGIRRPSNAWPFSLYKHCMTKKHKRTRILEKPVSYESVVLDSTWEDLPLLVSHGAPQVRDVVTKILKL